MRNRNRGFSAVVTLCYAVANERGVFVPIVSHNDDDDDADDDAIYCLRASYRTLRGDTLFSPKTALASARQRERARLNIIIVLCTVCWRL